MINYLSLENWWKLSKDGSSSLYDWPNLHVETLDCISELVRPYTFVWSVAYVLELWSIAYVFKPI